MIEVPYLVVSTKPEFTCPHCRTGLAAEWENYGSPDAGGAITESCPQCGKPVTYKTDAMGIAKAA